MKTGILTTKNIVSDDLQSEKSIMGMSHKGMEMASYFLRDKIYSDKILAVIREYICNAWDEHVKHSIQEYVEISLKTVQSQYVWSVRDYALGLNEHDIRNVFAMYFESTKSGSNDAIGGFGVGGKAAFAYTDTFYVVSHHEGTKTNYVCTLGAGQKGIPVGEIYKVSEEPTSEQGIEVSLEITKSDYYTFNTKTSTFVQSFLPNAKIKYKFESGVWEEPMVPEITKTVDDYVINGYNTYVVVGYGQHYMIRMGGVMYPYRTATSVPRKPSKRIVVDVPIGKLTIPISRESIENLPSNEKVFTEIENILTKISNDEIDGLTPPKLGSIMSRNVQTGQEYDGEWFRYSFASTFPLTYKYCRKVNIAKDNSNGYDGNYTVLTLPKGQVKYPIYVFPNIKTPLNSWHNRLQIALKEIQKADYQGYLWMHAKGAEEIQAQTGSSIDFSDCSFIDIKGLKLPKLDVTKKPKTDKFLVYGRYIDGKFFQQDSYSIDDINTWVTVNIFNNVDPADDWYLHTKSEDELNARTIGDTASWGTTRTSFFVANSTQLINGLYEIGWLDPSSQEYKDRLKYFRDEAQKKQILMSLDGDARSILFRTSIKAHTLKALKTNPDRINRLKAARAKILAEGSTRSRVLYAIANQYHSQITREDLRKILSLKD